MFDRYNIIDAQDLAPGRGDVIHQWPSYGHVDGCRSASRAA